MAVLSGAGERIVGDNPFDLAGLVDNGTVGLGAPSSTAFAARNAGFGLQWNFTGSGFSGFIDGFPSAGTITGVVLTRGTSSVTITGTSVSVPTVVLLLNVNDFAGITALMLANADTLTGTAFDDTLFGFAGNDSISGGAGSDGIRGGAGNDLIDGGDNNDDLDGGAGADTLLGGAGDDTLTRFSGDGPGLDVLDGGAGIDLARYSVSGSVGVTLTVADLATATGVTLADGTVIRNVEGVAFGGGSGADTLIISGAGPSGSSFGGGGGVDVFVANLGASTAALSFNAPGPFSVATFLGYTIFNDVELFRITTGAGADSINGGGGADTLTSNGGDDSVTGAGGGDSILGGAGADVLSGGFIDGSIANTGDDTIRGGDGNDTIFGYDGVNSLFGDAGDDFIRASGADVIDGGAGFDRLAVDLSAISAPITLAVTGTAFTLTGATLNVSNVELLSELTSGAGDDRISIVNPASGVEYRFNAGAGFDVFSVDLSAVTTSVSANTGGVSYAGLSDRVFLDGFEAINVKSGAGDDFIDGGSGNDTLDAGAGNDFFNLQLGRDSINGGAGDDTLGGFGSGSTLDGGEGIDRTTLDASDVIGNQTFDGASFSSGSFTFRGSTISNFEDFDVIGGAGNDSFTAAGVSASFRFIGGGGFDSAEIDLSAVADAVAINDFGVLGAAKDFAFTGVERFSVATGGGDDELFGNDLVAYLVSSGGGFDRLFGGALNDTLSAGTDDDEVDGRNGNDSLAGGAGSDLVSGGQGDDVVGGGDGADTLTGGAGRDTLDGGGGTDWADYAAAGAVNINLVNGTVISGGSIVNGSYAGGALEDLIVSVENILGSAFGDRIVAANAGSNIDSGDGADRVSGLNGDDTIFGGDGNDVLDGGGAEDLLVGFFGNDSINGGQSSDTISGGEGRDTLDGGTGFDTIDYSEKGGGVNVNVINGVALSGGFINSAGFYQGGAQEDVIANFENIIGSLFSDRLIAGSTSARIEGRGGNDFLFTFSGNDTLFGGDGADFLSSAKSTDLLFGEAGEDTLNGGTGFDTLDGGAQRDTADYSDRTGGVNVDLRSGTAVTAGTLSASGDYSGGFTEDRLVSIENVFGSNFGDRLTALADGSNLEGRGGGDRLIGGGGEDTIDGGAGNDTLSGGGGGDLFVFIGDFGADRVTDFVAGPAGADRLVLGGLGTAFDSFAEVIAAATQSGANVIFDFGGGRSITLSNVSLASIDADDIFFLS